MKSHKSDEKMNEINISFFREAVERSSDGWWAWEKKTNKVTISKKLCDILNIEINTNDETGHLKEEKSDWWKEYMEDNKRSQDFFNYDARKKQSIETEYAGKTINSRGNFRISKFLLEEVEKEPSEYIFLW